MRKTASTADTVFTSKGRLSCQLPPTLPSTATAAAAATPAAATANSVTTGSVHYWRILWASCLSGWLCIHKQARCVHFRLISFSYFCTPPSAPNRNAVDNKSPRMIKTKRWTAKRRQQRQMQTAVAGHGAAMRYQRQAEPAIAHAEAGDRMREKQNLLLFAECPTRKLGLIDVPIWKLRPGDSDLPPTQSLDVHSFNHRCSSGSRFCCQSHGLLLLSPLLVLLLSPSADVLLL